MIKFVVSVLLLSSMSFCYAQQNDSTYYYFNRVTPIEKIETKISNSKDVTNKNYYKLIYFSKQRSIDSMLKYKNRLEKDTLLLSAYQKARLLYFSGFLSKISDNNSLFLSYSNQAYNKALIIKDTLTVLYSLSALSQSYDYNNGFSYNMEYLDLLEQKANEFNNNYYKMEHRFLNGNYYLFRDKNKEAIENYKQLLNYRFTKMDSIYLFKTYGSLGSLYDVNLNQPDSAIYYYQKKLNLLKTNDNFKSEYNYFSLYNNIGGAYLNLNNFELAEYYYHLADSIPINERINLNKYTIKENLADFYYKEKSYKKAYDNLMLSNTYLDSLNQTEQQIAVANIKEEYDNEKLRGDNLESESKRKQNKNLLYGSLVLLFFGGITTTLFLKNSKRKRLLAEKNNVIEQQKVVTLLKEQELTSIDAMIEGQEKERKRIAEDLHDDLGSVLTTLKLHFENYKLNKDKKKFSENELIEKTDDLLDEAYTKVRGMAHAKNSGVIANQGLLVAIEDMAEKVSSSKKIEIKVIDHGLENRLENSLELTIFRIIQELITNIIKHANATEATIHLTNHDNSLNIMVEDNGVGFSPNSIADKKGMGIHSIDKRIEHLEGTMVIESEINKGTTVIIDIPI